MFEELRCFIDHGDPALLVRVAGSLPCLGLMNEIKRLPSVPGTERRLGCLDQHGA